MVNGEGLLDYQASFRTLFDMPQFSANISTLFQEAPLLDRIGLAKRAGFDGIEIQFPYEVEAAALHDALERAELPLVLFNLPAGDLLVGGPGNAAVAGREAEFAAAIELAYEYYQVLKPININILSGKVNGDSLGEDCLSVFAKNLLKCHKAFESTGIQLVVEAINTQDQPGFLLSRSAQAVALIKRLDAIDLGFQYDLYHMELMEANASLKDPAVFSKIKHFQFADAPGRHQPGSGTIDFQSIFNWIDASGYQGYVGAEYFPTGLTADSLGWLQRT
ncbi:MAG: hydroxypyruvate isomerase [Planctomycetota bacterium]